MSVRPNFPVATLRAFLCGALALLVVAPAARAQITAIQEVKPVELEEEEDYPFILYGISLLGGIALYDMTDLNESMSLINDEIAAQGSFGIKFGPLDNGASLGVQIRTVVADRYVLATSYERFIASSHVGGVTSESRIEVPADVIEATLGYDLLASHNAAFGFGIGFGWYSSRAEQVITETLASQDERELGRIQLEGSTISPHYEVFFETRFTDRLFVGISGGYRSAKIQDIEIKGLADVQDPRSDTAFISIPVAVEDPLDPTNAVLRNGGNVLDWTGLYGRATMTFYLNIPTF